MKQILMLNGLCCANCAAKIETEVNRLEGVQSASVDFVSKMLVFESEPNADIAAINKNIKGIVNKIEPDVSVALYENVKKPKTDATETNDENEEENHKTEIIKLVVGGAVFAVGIIFSFQNF